MSSTSVAEHVVPAPIYQYLATSTGGINAVGDYSTGAGGSSGMSFYIKPTSTQDFRIERMMVHVQDTGAFAAEEYGAMTALTNGVQVRVRTSTGTPGALDGITHDLTGTLPVKTNAQWGRQCYDVRVDTWAAGDEFLSARWTFSKGGYPLRLDGTLGQYLEVHLQDSTTGLNEHNFYVNGYIEDAAFKQFG